MADLTVFSNKNFNSTFWINNTIKEINNEESIESYITSLSTKLHIMSQDYTDQLETAMFESISIMPRVLSEITKTEEQLKNIEIEMKNLSLQLNTFDERNVIGVEDLSRLDMLKTNMEKCKATLEEHARWSQLVREAKILLESGSKLSDSADRIEIMFHSLDILKNLPGHEERQETCETFRNSLLSALRPIVAKDIAGFDIGPLKEYLYVFEKLGRKNELVEQYVSARPNHIKLYWNEYHMKEISSIDFIKCLSFYFNKILKLINDEENNTIVLFGKEKSLAIMCDMIYESLQPYTKTLQSRLIGLKSNSPLLICQSYQLTDDFTKRIMVILKSINNESYQLKLLDSLYLGYHSEVDVYIKNEEMYLSEKLTQLIDIVMFIIPDSKNYQTNNVNNASLDEELFGDGSESSSNSSLDTIYANYCEKLLLICNTFHSIIEEILQRTIVYIGGTAIKSILRTIAYHLNLFVKKLVLKMDDLTIACGYPSINYSSTTSNTNTMNESDSNKITSQQSNLDLQVLTSKDLSSSHSSSQVVTVVSNAEKLGMKLSSRNDLEHKSLVVTALKSLQAIGRLHKQFHHLEVLTKDILLSLQQQVFNSMSLFKSLDKYDTNVAIDTTNNTSIGVIYSLHVLHSNEDNFNELKSFLVASTSSNIISQSVYSNINPSICKLKFITTSLLFNLCIETPEKIISTLSSEDVWYTKTVSRDNSSENVKTSIEIIVKLCENLLPQSIISQVGEYMLSLVQELESFASSEALYDLLKLKGESKVLPCLSSGWQKVKNILNITETETLLGLSNHMKCANLIATLETTLLGSSELALAIAQSGGNLFEDYIIDEFYDDSYEVVSNNQTYSNDSSNNNSSSNSSKEVIDHSNHLLIFVNEWLTSIFDAIVGVFIAQISEISILTLHGSAQLLTDLEYLSNVCNAMGIRIHPLLTHIKTLLQQEPLSLLTMIESLYTTISETNKGSIGYLLKFDLLLVHSIAKGNNL